MLLEIRHIYLLDLVLARWLFAAGEWPRLDSHEILYLMSYEKARMRRTKCRRSQKTNKLAKQIQYTLKSSTKILNNCVYLKQSCIFDERDLFILFRALI